MSALTGWAALDGRIIERAKLACDPLPLSNGKVWLTCPECLGDGEMEYLGLTDVIAHIDPCDSCDGAGGWEVEPFCCACHETRPLNGDGECASCSAIPQHGEAA